MAITTEVPEDVRREESAEGTERLEKAENEEIREAFQPTAEREALPVYSAQPNMFRRYPGRVLFYAALMGGGLYFVIDSLVVAEYSLLKLMLGLALVTWGSIRMGAWYMRNRSTTVTVTQRSIVLTRGTFKPESTEVLMEDVQTVQASQDFFGRLLGVGDVGVVTRGNLTNFLVLGVPDPDGLVNAWRAAGGPEKAKNESNAAE